MTGAFATTSMVIAALAVLWIGVAIALAIAAARRLRLAEAVLGTARSSAALLEAMPARPMVDASGPKRAT